MTLLPVASVPRDVLPGSYSSGYCSGFTPDSLLIPGPERGSGNLDTLNNLLQRYCFFIYLTTKKIFFLSKRQTGDDSVSLPKGYIARSKGALDIDKALVAAAAKAQRDIPLGLDKGTVDKHVEFTHGVK